jgi:hypothetical protein
MNKLILIILLANINLQSYAQQDNFPKKETHDKVTNRKSVSPVLFINVSTGINNNTGLIGASVEVPVVKHLTVEGGFGISSWGSKLTASVRYYLKNNFKGWAFGAGLTHNSGLKNFQDNLETVYGTTESVTLDLHPRTNVFAAAYKYWRLGKRANRVYLELGYSVSVSGGNKFDQTSGTPISSNSENVINIISPGGPIVGFGFSFGI